MSEYQLEIKQVMDYPRCRIYRQFIQSLMNDRSIRVSGGSGLFYFAVLSSYASFRTSYRRIDGISYTVYPGEWVCTLKEVSEWFRTRFQWQAQGSEIGPVVYLRNNTGNPLVTYSELGTRWGLSKATTGRVLKKLSDAGYLSLMTFPGRHGNVIYLQNYLSTMFQISDVMIDKEEVAMVLNIKLELPENGEIDTPAQSAEHDICVSEELSSVSESHIPIILEKMAHILTAQGIPCFGCPKSKYKLSPLSNACGGKYLPRARDASIIRMRLTIFCGDDRPITTFELTLSPKWENSMRRQHDEEKE